VLGKKERNAVIACGKNPDRKEADIEHGRPTNTEYRGITHEPGATQEEPPASTAAQQEVERAVEAVANAEA